MNALIFNEMPKRVWYARNTTTGETVLRNSRSMARDERTMMKNRGAKSVQIGYFTKPTVDPHG